MNDTPQKKPIGSFSWADLTVEDAGAIRDFYCRVVGWTSAAHSMGEYDDFCMQAPESGQTVAGICHARGANSKLPPQWLIYLHVEDLQASIAEVETLGGKVIDGPRTMGDSSFAIIQDPAGACVALYQE